MDEYFLSRRQLFAGLGVTAAGLIAGCAQAAPAAARSMTVYRDPGCGCCLNWVALARRAGFAVRVVDSQNIMAIKRQAGVPPALVATTGTTDASVFGNVAGIPAVCFGPFAEAAHGVGERVYLPSVIQTAQVMGLFIRDWCGLSR